MTLNHITVSKDVTGVLYCHCAIISVLSFYLYLMLMMSKCGILTSFLHNYIQGPLLSKHPIFQHAKYTLCHVLNGKVWDICQEYFRQKWVMSPYNYFSSSPPITTLTHWPLGDLKIFFKMSFSNSYPESIPWAIPAKLLSEVCHRTPLMISQHWVR